MEEKITNNIALLGSQIKEDEELPVKMILNVIDIMKNLGINRLALWDKGFILLDECDQIRVLYNEEDKQLFGELRPDFYHYLGHGIDEDYLNPIFAVELNNKSTNVCEKLDFIYMDDENKQVCRMPADIALSAIAGESILELMKAILMSIQFNIENNIPIEKWGIGHAAEVNPYTYEYVADFEF